MSAATSDQVLERLNRLHPKLIDLGLTRVYELLERLQRPHDKLAPVIHVAGTNGKGSTLANLRAFLEADGGRVQVYTSPHLVRFHERIRLTDGLIAEDALVSLLEDCEAANRGEPITYFEITTVAAFLAFSRQAADFLLLETGLGGRMDATNVVDRPALNILTSIDLDHAQFLGDSIAKIAFEKAGILKPGVKAVVGPQPPEALEVIGARAAEVGAPLLRHGEEWDYGHLPQDKGLWVSLDGQTMELPAPRLLGPHQWENSAVAAAAAMALGEKAPSQKAIALGAARVEWPGRLQVLEEGPFYRSAKVAGPDWELWLDGGHNAEAGRVMAKQLALWSDKPLHLVCAMMNTKAAANFLAPLAAHAASSRYLAIPDEPGAFTAEDLASLGQEAGLPGQAFASVPEAINDLLHSEQPGRVLICGSIYFIGKVLDHARWDETAG